MDERSTDRSENFRGFSEKWIVFSVGILLIFHIIIQMLLPVVGFCRDFILSWTAVQLIIEGCFYITIYIVGLSQIKNRFGLLALIGAYFCSSEVLWDTITEGEIFAFVLGTFLLYILVGIGMIGLLLTIILVIERTLQNLPEIKTYLERLVKEIKQIETKTIIILSIFVCNGIIYGLYENALFMQREIHIQPQDYQMGFRVWAEIDPSYYIEHPHGTDMLDQFNRHNVTIQNYWVPIRDKDGNLESFSPSVYKSDQERIVSNLTWFYTNYPNIRFQYYAAGVGYGSCGNYEGSIYTPALVKRFVDIMRNESLPNVIGIYTDWEGPGDGAPETANFTRNGMHEALWRDAMAYSDYYFPDWTFSCCFPPNMMWELMDKDYDLENFNRYNIYHPYWDDYGPMIYRSCRPNRIGGGESSYYVYSSAYVLTNGMLNNDISRATMWIGCMGCGPYRNDTLAYEHGELIDFGDNLGFDALARDLLILKHFGLPIVSLFTTRSTFESNSRITGFFHQYGFTDALDRLNATINGPDSTEDFSIWTNGRDETPLEHIADDYLVNYNRYEYIPVFLGHLFVGFLLFKLYDKRNCHLEKSEKTKL